MPNLTTAIQEALVALYCFDDGPKGARAVRALVPPKYFDPYYKDIALQADLYLTQYGKVPDAHTLDIIESLKARDEEKAEVFDRIYESLLSTRGEINSDYVLDQARRFAEYQKLKAGITRAIDSLQDEDRPGAVDEAKAALHNALKPDPDLSSIGIDFRNVDDVLKFIDKPQEVFSCGIAELDRYEAGPIRKGLLLFVAPSNRGKTWACCHYGKFGVIARKTVVHITLEMSEEKIAQRYVQAFFAVGKRDVRDLSVKRFERDDLGRFVGMTDDLVGARPHLQQSDIRSVLKQKLTDLGGRPRLIIKEFPTGSLTISGLKNYLDILEGQCGIIPDILIVDYPDLMQIDPRNFRIELGRVFKELRGIGVERNIAIVAPSQGNRESTDVVTVREKHVGEDYSKFQTADTVITYSQTESEYELGLARLTAAKVRDDTRGFTVLISQGYAIGQFCLDSAMLTKKYWQQIKRDADHEDDEDDD